MSTTSPIPISRSGKSATSPSIVAQDTTKSGGRSSRRQPRERPSLPEWHEQPPTMRDRHRAAIRNSILHDGTNWRTKDPDIAVRDRCRSRKVRQLLRRRSRRILSSHRRQTLLAANCRDDHRRSAQVESRPLGRVTCISAPSATPEAVEQTIGFDMERELSHVFTGQIRSTTRIHLRRTEKNSAKIAAVQTPVASRESGACRSRPWEYCWFLFVVAAGLTLYDYLTFQCGPRRLQSPGSL